MKYSNDDMLRMYRTMLTSRLYDEEMLRQNKMGRMVGMLHWSINEEAIDAAIVTGMEKGDYFMPSHRSRALHLSTEDMRGYTAEMSGLKSGVAGGISSDFHIVNIDKGFVPNPGVLGAGSPIATGFAFGIKRTHPGKVIVQIMGDGTFNQGMVHEALNWAVIQKLPIVFVVRNNMWQSTTYAPDAYRTVDNIADRARACGMDAVSVDGQDILACREAVDIAIKRAREQNLPSLIEAKTYRIYGHYNGDTAFYRDAEKHDEMVKRFPDPIPKMEEMMVENGVATAKELEAIKGEMNTKIKAIIEEVYQETLDKNNFVQRDEIVGHPELIYTNVEEGLQ